MNPRRTTAGRTKGGFTLFEVMVALAVLAIALGAVMRSVGAATRNIDELRLRTLAGWVAENVLAEHRARQDWLSPGRYEGQAAQGGTAFRWKEEVQLTPNGQFRRVDVQVLAPAENGGEERVLARLSGFMTAPGGRR